MNAQNFNEMVVFDFSNLNLQQGDNDNCFSCDCDKGGSGCDGGCDGGVCDSNCNA